MTMTETQIQIRLDKANRDLKTAIEYENSFNAELRNNGKFLGGIARIDIEFCTLALRGLKTTPRPIEDAPKDGSSIILIDGKGATQGFWVPEIEESSDQPPYAAGWFSTSGDDMNPTHFIPLSALEVK